MSDEPIFIHSIRRDMERTPHNRGGIIEHKPLSPGVGKCGTYGDNLVREWDEVASEVARLRALVASIEDTAAAAIDDDGRNAGWAGCAEIRRMIAEVVR
jgi:hypothetical protein